MYSDPTNKIKVNTKKRVWSLGVFCLLLGLVWTQVSLAVDADSDGLDSTVDNTDSISIFVPQIISPLERAGIADDSLNATFSGTGEIDTQVRIFKDAAQQCSADVSGNGISSGTGSSVSIDGTTLVSGAIQAQFFYDTTSDSASTSWRTGSSNSWYSETKDDTTDSVCDHETDDGDDDPRSGEDDRCGESTFPSKVILVATNTEFIIFDAQKKTFWKSFSLAGITSIFALNGSIYVGTSSGLQVYDFASDDFTVLLTTISTPAIENNFVEDLDGKTLSAKDYIVVGTRGGTSIFNATDNTVISKTTDDVSVVSIDSDDKLRYALDSTSFVSDDTVDTLSADWDVTDISTGTNFSSGTSSTAHGDFIGHTSGITQIQSELVDIENGLVYKDNFDSLSRIASNAYGNGTINGGATLTTGRTSSDSAMLFDGDNDSVETDLTSNTYFGSSGYTISAWIKPSSRGEGNYARIVDKSTWSDCAGGFCYFMGPTNTVGARVMGSTQRYSADNSVPYDEWTHVLVTIGSPTTTVTHYINGVQSGTPGTSGGNYPNSVAPVTIGNRSNNENFTFDGSISDVKIYNRILTQDEITTLAAGGTSAYSYIHRTKDYATPAFTLDEKGYWFDSVTDRSLSGNDLTNNNSVTISEAVSGTDTQQFTFNGTSNYLSSSSTDFNITGSELTVGMWIKRASTGGSGAYAQILSHGTSRDTRSYFLSAGDEFFDYPLAFDPYFFGVQTASGFKAASVQTTPVTDTWEFIVGTYDGSNVRIYRNGVLEEVNPHTGNIVSAVEDLRIGYGYEDEYFAGNVALPFISDNALTSEQIAAYYSLTSNWFTVDTAVTLAGTASSVTDVDQHSLRNSAYISTNDGVTKLNTTTGVTTQVVSSTDVSNMAVTHLGSWTCSATMDEGGHTIFAKAFIGANASDIVSGNRIFYLNQSSSDDFDGDGLDNDDDNDQGTAIATPIITSIDRVSEDSFDYTFTGTGDGLFKTLPNAQQVPTRVGLFVLGENEPFVYADVGQGVEQEDGSWSNGTWQTDATTMETGSQTIYARAYIQTNASTIDSEQTQLNVEAIAAGAPTPNALDSYTGSNQLTFSWVSNVPSAQFYAELSTSSDFTANVQNSGWISETSHNFQNLTNGQIYYFRVKLRDASGTETSFSEEEISTTIDTSNPSVGTVSNGGDYQPSLSTNFSWSGFSDNGGSGIDHYEIYIADDEDFSNVVYEHNHYVTNYKAYVGTQGGTYYAKVRAVDEVGNKSNFVYSAGTTLDSTAPASFVLADHANPSPPGNQNISWTASADGESGIENYTIYRTDYAYVFTYPNWNWEIEIGERSLGTTVNTYYTDTNTEREKKYIYKIAANNRAGLSTDSNTIQFEVNLTEEHAPVLENIDPYTTDDSVVVDWTVATDVYQPSAYQVYKDDSLLDTTADADTTSYTDSASKTDGQVYEYKVRAQDAEENTGDFSSILRVLADKTAPTTSESLSGTANGEGWYNTSVTVTLSATDSGTTLFNPNTSDSGTGYYSGVSQIVFNKNGAGITPYNNRVTFDTDCTAGSPNTLSFYAADIAGNEETPQNITIKIDITNPTPALALDPDLMDENGFTSENSTAYTPSGTDAHSGVASVVTYVQFDQNGDGALAGDNDVDFTQISTTTTEQTYYFTDTGLVDGTAQDGQYNFKVIVTDNAGNSTESDITAVKVDRTAPVTIDNAPSTDPATLPLTITLTPSDQTVSSGISQTYYTTDGSTPTTGSTAGTSVVLTEDDLTAGRFTVKYFSTDGMSNAETVKTATNIPTDTDSDGMLDWWEDLHGLDKNSDADAATDGDSDNLTNLQEFQNNTDPANNDSDGDTIIDGTEVSDGTDPSSSVDHRVILIAPKTTTDNKTDTTFTFLGNAPVGKTVSVKNSLGAVIGTGVSDASGRVFIELTLVAGSNHDVTAEFVHDNGGLVKTGTITIHVASGTLKNPKFTNISDNSLFQQGFINIEISGKASARIQVFDVRNGNLVSLNTGTTDGSGDVSIGLPNTFVGQQLLAVDQTNLLTSELINVTRGVYVSGQVLDTAGNPLQNITIKLIDGADEYQTVTDINGDYAFTVPRNRTFLFKAYHQAYLKYEETITITDIDPKISPTLFAIEAPNLIQTEDGLVQISSSGGASLRRAGMTREESLKIAEQGYEAAIKQAEEINVGQAGKIITGEDRYGREVFIGYVPGQRGVDEFEQQPEIARRITGLFGSERRAISQGKSGKEFYSADAQKVCLKASDSVANFSDVPNKGAYTQDIIQMNSYGIIKADSNNKFRPNQKASWEDILKMVMAANCIDINHIINLQRAELPSLKGVALENNLKSLVFYTALEEGIIDVDFDIDKSPTRKDVLLVLASSFGLDINEKAWKTSFQDVLKEDPIAPVLVAAKGTGWFTNFQDTKFFYHEKPITRAEFSSWFINALKYKEANVTPRTAFQKFMEKLRGKEVEQQARLGIRQTETVSEAETHALWRKYEQAQEPEYARPLRSTWNPLDPNSTRAPMKIIDKSENIRRGETKKILRDITKTIKESVIKATGKEE